MSHFDKHTLAADEVEIGLGLVGEELLHGPIDARLGVVIVTNQDSTLI
jgi:hypothetical protein